ncbi:MAG: hypothetical protein ABFR75_04795 [Acidobacteriota bacterium]
MKNKVPITITVFVIIFLYFSSNLVAGKTDINDLKNGKVPERKAELKKVMEITDDSQNFYFKYPHDLKTGNDGSIYFRDSSQMLRFDQEGKLLNNYYKKGQGPGESVSVRGYFLKGDNLIIFSGSPKKIMEFHKNGKYLKEFRLFQKFLFGKLILYNKEGYYFVNSEIPVIKNNGWNNVKSNFDLIKITGPLKMTKTKTFAGKMLVMKYGNGRSYNRNIKFVWRIHKGGKYLALSHTEKYSVKIYDIKKNLVIRKFNRKYKRFKDNSKKNSDWVSFNGKKFFPPKREYDSDINNIYLQNKEILVETSRINMEKGRLIDRFSWEGKYLDYFYLKTKGDIMMIQNNYVYVREKDEDENLFIVKYQLNIIKK